MLPVRRKSRGGRGLSGGVRSTASTVLDFGRRKSVKRAQWRGTILKTGHKCCDDHCPLQSAGRKGYDTPRSTMTMPQAPQDERSRWTGPPCSAGGGGGGGDGAAATVSEGPVTYAFVYDGVSVACAGEGAAIARTARVRVPVPLIRTALVVWRAPP